MVLIHEIRDNVMVMRTSARILISLGLAAGVFGALVLWTEWGQRNFRPDADLTGAFWLFISACCLVLGGLVQVFSKAGEPPVEASDETPGDDEDDDPGTPLCPSCLAPTEPLQHFCAECGSPLTSHAEIDPIGRIYSMGYTFGKAVDSPRRLIVLVGMWCIFGLPMLLVTIISAALIAQQAEYSFPDEGGLLDWGETSGWSASWAMGGVLSVLLLLGFVLLYGAIVVKTTKNYFCGDQTTDREDADATGPGAESPPGVVVATRVLGRILIFIGVSVVVFGVLVLGTRWGVRDYGPDAGEAGEFAVLFGAGVLVLGVVALVGPKNPRRRRDESRRRDPNEKVPAPPRRIVSIASWLLFGGPGAVVIIVMWLTSWHDSKISSESWRLSTILVLVIVTGFIVSIVRFLVRWSLGTYSERVRSDLLDPENVKDDA